MPLACPRAVSAPWALPDLSSSSPLVSLHSPWRLNFHHLSAPSTAHHIAPSVGTGAWRSDKQRAYSRTSVPCQTLVITARACCFRTERMLRYRAACVGSRPGWTLRQNGRFRLWPFQTIAGNVRERTWITTFWRAFSCALQRRSGRRLYRRSLLRRTEFMGGTRIPCERQRFSYLVWVFGSIN
jgi:hypothetical protein